MEQNPPPQPLSNQIVHTCFGSPTHGANELVVPAPRKSDFNSIILAIVILTNF